MEHTHIAKDGTVYTHTHEEAHEHGHSHSHPHHHENTKAVLNRMNRAIGHMEAVKTMIEDGRDCSEVLIQIAAVRSAINNIGKIILEDHINHCLVDAIETGDDQVLKESRPPLQGVARDAGYKPLLLDSVSRRIRLSLRSSHYRT